MSLSTTDCDLEQNSQRFPTPSSLDSDYSQKVFSQPIPIQTDDNEERIKALEIELGEMGYAPPFFSPVPSSCTGILPMPSNALSLSEYISTVNALEEKKNHFINILEGLGKNSQNSKQTDSIKLGIRQEYEQADKEYMQYLKNARPVDEMEFKGRANLLVGEYCRLLKGRFIKVV